MEEEKEEVTEGVVVGVIGRFHGYYCDHSDSFQSTDKNNVNQSINERSNTTSTTGARNRK